MEGYQFPPISHYRNAKGGGKILFAKEKRNVNRIKSLEYLKPFFTNLQSQAKSG